VRDRGGSRLGAVAVEMAQGGANVTTVVDRPGELTGSPPWLVCVIVDPLTVLVAVQRRPNDSGRGRVQLAPRSPASRAPTAQSIDSAGANSASGVTVSIGSPATSRRSRRKKPGARTRWMSISTMPLPSPRMPIQSGTPSPRKGGL
jgi:hypothetical protein